MNCIELYEFSKIIFFGFSGNRSEKLYVTKDKRKVNSWKKYICWLIGACILLSIVTIAILAGRKYKKKKALSFAHERRK